ncbi:MAG: hypothetical protein MJA83_06595, partial [Gammaproteobacteria bacterium]|nr:hypothetical protein [Gammaproteobacteria bacterium]
MAGLRATPPLKGLVLTGPKNHPLVDMPLVGEEGEPLFAHWNVGLGRTAAFTSDASNRWGAEWLKWGGYGDFWSRTVRLVARPSAGRGYDLVSTVKDNRLHLHLEATRAATENNATNDGSFINFLQVVGTVITPDNETITVKLRQTGPGQYEADVPADQTGNYIVSLMTRDRDGQNSAVFGGASRPEGPELRSFTSNRTVLERVAEVTGGRVIDPGDPQPADLFSRQAGFDFVTRSLRPIWRTLMIWLLALFLLDVAVRRVAWDYESVRAAIAGRVERFMAMFKHREVEATATLGALKRRSAKVNERLDAVEPAPPTRQMAARKFEAAEGAEATEDFAAAVGAATLDEKPARAAATSVAGD